MPTTTTAPDTTTLPIIGLFGTCGASTWRREFIAAYEARGLRYFNPQVEHWNAEQARIENEHFHRDAILLFAVTADTPGFGGLAEIGLSILEIERHNHRHPAAPRHVLVFVDPACTDPKASEAQIKDSLRARKLVAGKLPAYTGTHVHVCASLDELLQRSLDLAGPVAGGTR